MAIVTLITGDRYWTDYQFILDTIRSWHSVVGISLVVHGACRGADNLADRAANTLGIPTDPMPADWDAHGLAAGSIRNGQMLIRHPEIELVLAFHDNIAASRGTRNMLNQACGQGKLCVLTGHDGVLVGLEIFSK